jgi:hypothetical protein
MAAVSMATGLRTWLQTHHFGWLTPRRMRMLTLSAMGAAAIVSTIGFSGSTPATASQHALPSGAAAHAITASR